MPSFFDKKEIIMKKCIQLFFVIFTIMLLCSCNHRDIDNSSTSNATTQSTTHPTTVEETVNTETKADVSSTSTTTSTTTEDETTAASVLGVTIPEKSGDMYYTDDVNNKFIQAVAKKYNISPEGLACAYSVPESDTNQVWQFSSSTRNANTLKYVYIISADCKTIVRAGGVVGNDGIDTASGILTMQVTKKLIIPEFQDELNK